jgi:hypothetical protein
MGTGRNKRDRYTGPRRIANVLDKAMGATSKARGFTQAAVITQWPAIVGESWGRDCAPEKLVFPRGERSGATLHIRTPGSVAIELQHVEPVLIDRINRYFGFRAVARLALTQAPVAVPGPVPDAARPPLTPADETRLQQTVTAVADAELRGALLNLGHGVVRNKAAQRARAAKRNG